MQCTLGLLGLRVIPYPKHECLLQASLTNVTDKLAFVRRSFEQYSLFGRASTANPVRASATVKMAGNATT